MSIPINSLNNARLEEKPLSVAEYNQLPHIDSMREAAAHHSKAHAVLLGIIAAHKISGTFSLHLVHKHFDIPEGRFMVYEKIKSENHADFVLCSPKISQKCPDARGLYFKAASDGSMIAYEFTTEPGADLSAHEDFVADFASTVLKFGVQDVFALTALSICLQGKILTEYEIGHALSTILVSDPGWLLTAEIEDSTSTDWVATSDYAQYAEGSIPGIIQLKCLQTRGGVHYNVTCSRTRGRTHLGHASDPIGGGRPMESAFKINGVVLPEGSEPHAIIPHALQLVDVV